MKEIRVEHGISPVHIIEKEPPDDVRQGSRRNGEALKSERFGKAAHAPITEVSAESLRRSRIAAADEESPVADQFKLLRTRLFHSTRAQGRNTIQITGFGCGEGKTTIALNLAVTIAKDSRQTILLVDLNFRNPSVHTMLGLSPNTLGLKSYFFEGVPLEEIFINPGIENLRILPAGGRIPRAPELMGSSRMEALVKELKERYPDRYILFDTPPLNEYPDALVFSEYVDGMVLVARSGRTTMDAVRAVEELLPREKILGLVFNDWRYFPLSENRKESSASSVVGRVFRLVQGLFEGLVHRKRSDSRQLFDLRRILNFRRFF